MSGLRRSQSNERDFLERIEQNPVGFFDNTLILATTSSYCENTFYHHACQASFPTVEVGGNVNFISRFNLISRTGATGRSKDTYLNTPHVGLLVHSLTTDCDVEYLSSQIFDFTQDFVEKQNHGFSYNRKLSSPRGLNVCGHLMRGSSTFTLPLARAIDFDCTLEQHPETIHIIGLDADGVAHETIWREKLYDFQRIKLEHKATCIQSLYHIQHNSFFLIGTDHGLYNEKGDLVAITMGATRTSFNTKQLAIKELVPVSETQVLVRAKGSNSEGFYMIEAKGEKLIAREMRLCETPTNSLYSEMSQTLLSFSKDNNGRDIIISNWETSVKGSSTSVPEKVFRQTSRRHTIQFWEATRPTEATQPRQTPNAQA